METPKMFFFIDPNDTCPRLVLSINLPVGSHMSQDYMTYLGECIAEEVNNHLYTIGIAADAQMKGVAFPRRMSDLEKQEANVRALRLNQLEATIEQIAKSMR